MVPNESSRTNVRYVISLLAPQGVRMALEQIRRSMVSPGLIPAPMDDALLPLVESDEPPPPPVPGLLPPCDQPLVLSQKMELSANREWWIWPVDSGDWTDRLSRELAPADDRTGLYPARVGIPVAARLNGEDTAETALNPGISGDGIPRWRALNLVCHEIVFEDRQRWYLSLRWRELWSRRLRRAPVQTNNNKTT